MNEHIKELMHRHIDGMLDKTGQRELQEALRDPQCREYFEKLKKADDFVQKGLAEAIKRRRREKEGIPSREEIENDIRKYGGKMDEDFRQKMEELHRRHLWRQRRKQLVIQWSSAAAVLVLGIVFLWAGLNPGPKRLYSRYYIPHDFYAVRSEGTVPAEYSEATDYYNEGNYEASAVISGTLSEREPGNADYRFLYALSLQGKGEIEAAVVQYRILLEDNKVEDEMIYPLSAWYLGLCYLLEGDKDSADRYFGIAAEEGGMWIDREKVEEIRGRL